MLDGHELVVTASIGIALSGANDESAEEVVRNADIAMYRAKSRGKAGYVVFDEAMHAEAVARLQLETDLRQAATPAGIAASITSRSCRCEPARSGALKPCLRWYHPDRGMVYPDEFVPLAEETKLILPMGLWVIRSGGRPAPEMAGAIQDDSSRCP